MEENDSTSPGMPHCDNQSVGSPWCHPNKHTVLCWNVASWTFLSGSVEEYPWGVMLAGRRERVGCPSSVLSAGAANRVSLLLPSAFPVNLDAAAQTGLCFAGVCT